VAKALLEILEPIQEAYQKSTEWQEVAVKAYPEPVPVKKEKKAKNKGTRKPGAPGAPESQELPIRPKEDGEKPAA
jgi:tyrosyl-tRNA synthetase